MFQCSDYQELMVDDFYNEMPADQRRKLAQHLETCSECKEIYREMADTLAVMSKRKRQDPGSQFWNNYWSRLEPRLVEEQPGEKVVWWKKNNGASKILLQAAAAAFLILLGVIIGKFYFGNRVDTPPPITKKIETPSPAAVSTVNDRAHEFLERSEVLLLGIVNSGEGQFDLSKPKDVSRGLIRNASTLKKELNSPEQQKLRRLVSDLEVILLQIANLETERDMPQIELIKDGVDRRSVLMKINLEKMRMAEPHVQKADRPSADGGI